MSNLVSDSVISIIIDTVAGEGFICTKTNQQMRFVKTVLIVANATADTIRANFCGIFRHKECVIESLETETVVFVPRVFDLTQWVLC